MFKLILRSIQLSLFLSGWGLAALSLHVVRTPDKIGLIPKQRLGFEDTYVDARKWTMADLPAHAELVQRILQADKAELLQYLTDPSRGDPAGQLNTAINGSTVSEPAGLTGKIQGLFGAAGLPVPQEAKTTSLPVDF